MKPFGRNVTADDATVRVLEERVALARHISANGPVSVVMTGTIDGFMSKDVGGGRSFTIDVEDIHLEADCVVLSEHGACGQPFELSAGDVERLAALADRTGSGNIGLLATADYHDQGRVHVPAEWLRELVRGYRQAHPASAAFYFELEDLGDGSTAATVLPKDAAHFPEGIEHTDIVGLLAERLPYGGQATSPNSLIYRSIKIELLRTAFLDAGFRDFPASTR